MIRYFVRESVFLCSCFIKDFLESSNSCEERFFENIFGQETNNSIARKKSENSGLRRIFKNSYQNKDRVRLALSQFPIVVKIFSNLDVGDQISCMKVCSLWHSFGNSQYFISLAGMNETWRSHKMLSYMKSSIPQLKNLNRAANIHFLKKASITVLREGAIIGICYVANKYISNFLDNQNNILNSLTLEEKTQRMIDYNNTPINDDYGPIIPYDNPDDFISIEVSINNIIKRFHNIEIASIALWRITSAAYEIKRIWQDRFKNNANDSAAAELKLPLELSQDPILSQFVCFRSNRVMLLPVQDECPINNDNPENGHDHVFDYLSLENLAGPIICPFSGRVIPEQNLKFRLDIFKKVQSRLKELAVINRDMNGQLPRLYNLKANILF